MSAPDYFELMQGFTRATLLVEDYLRDQERERAINQAVERDRDNATQPKEDEHDER